MKEKIKIKKKYFKIIHIYIKRNQTHISKIWICKIKNKNKIILLKLII
jgi:hypothetical protein